MQQEGLRTAPERERADRPAVRGPAAVRASLIAAAGELFAARGTTSVSVREIADRAGVNHGLIHHYFNSKQGLVDATLDELAAHATKSLEHGIDVSPDGPLGRYLLVAGRVLLDSESGDQPGIARGAGVDRAGSDAGEHGGELARAGGLTELLRRLAELDPATGAGSAAVDIAPRAAGTDRVVSRGTAPGCAPCASPRC